MSVLPIITDSVTVKRMVYNAVTKQSALTTMYTALPVFIKEAAKELKAGQAAPEWAAVLCCDLATDITDGDQIVGWNPLSKATPPTCVVDKANAHQAPGMPGFPGVRTVYLKILER